MQIDLTQIIMAVLTLIFGLLMRYVIPELKARMNADQMELLRIAVKTAVYGVEQLYESKPGQEKKKLVLEELQRQGYIVDMNNVEKTIDYLVESVVQELNIAQGKAA